MRGMSDLLERSLVSGIVIETRFPLRLPLVMVDPNQFETALLNLVVNARDAMPDGGRITIGARAWDEGPAEIEDAKNGFVCVSVDDTGHGMDEETLARATEPFYTTKGVGKGTGLGLPMVQGMLEQFGGKLVIETRLGQGHIRPTMAACRGRSTNRRCDNSTSKRNQPTWAVPDHSCGR